MFIDEAKIRVKAGGGGNGCVAFRREKYVPRGGPSGGDGGKGGDIYMESSERHNTLVHFRFNPEYKAERGRHGEGANKTGRKGTDDLLSCLLVVDDCSHGNLEQDVCAFPASLVGAFAVTSALGFVFRIEAEVNQSVVALAGFHDDVAALAAIAA